MKKIMAFVLLAVAMAAPAGAVSTGYYLISAYDNAGQKTVDFKFWSRRNPGAPVFNAPDIGFGYGVTSRWYTEVYLSYISSERIGGTTFKDVTWQNDYLLTQGEVPFDLALHTSVIDYRDPARGTGFEFGPILQTDFGRTQVNGGLLFERDYRGAPANAMQMKYQWQVKYRWQHSLHVGVQGFGELGDWNHWLEKSRQSHRAGPALSGTVPMTESQSLLWDLSYLVGSFSAQHAKAVSLRVQYAF